MYREIIALCSDTHGKHINTLCGQNVEFVNVKPGRNCLLKQVIEGKITVEMEVARRRGRRRKKLLDDLKNRRGFSHFKEEALDRTV